VTRPKRDPGHWFPAHQGEPKAHAELLHVLRLSDIDRVEPMGEFWGQPKTRSSVELLIGSGGGQGGAGDAVSYLSP
jgi:hypothetical protein